MGFWEWAEQNRNYESDEGGGGQQRPPGGGGGGVGVRPPAAASADRAGGRGGGGGAGLRHEPSEALPGRDAGPPLRPPRRHGRLLLPPDQRPSEPPQVLQIHRRLRRVHPPFPSLPNHSRTPRSALLMSLFVNRSYLGFRS